MLAIATRDTASQRIIANLPEHAFSLGWLAHMTAQFISQLTDPKTTTADAQPFRHDALLVSRSLFVVSALRCEDRVNQGESPYNAIKSHIASVRDAVVERIEVMLQQDISSSDSAQICAKVIEVSQNVQLNDASAEYIEKTTWKVGTTASTDVHTSHPEATLLRILCDATHDLAVAANTAVDVLEDLSVDDDGATSMVASQAMADAADACKMVWQALSKLLALHVKIFMSTSDQRVNLNMHIHHCVNVALCSKLSVQAIFRGTAYRLPVSDHEA